MSGDKNKLVANGGVQMEVRTSFSGPLPPPEVLHGYESVLPGLASLIIPLGVIIGAFVYQKREETKDTK